jgi:hypothetical protein
MTNSTTVPESGRCEKPCLLTLKIEYRDIQCGPTGPGTLKYRYVHPNVMQFYFKVFSETCKHLRWFS